MSESDVKCIFEHTPHNLNKYYLSVSPVLHIGFSNTPVNVCSTILLCDLISNFNVWLKLSVTAHVEVTASISTDVSGV